MRYLSAVLFVVLLITGCSSPEEVKEGISTPDVSSIPDGTYQGRAFIFPVRVTAEVELLDGRIASISLLRHFNGQGKAAEAVTEVVLRHQSLDVDVISGATQSSITILKALEDALSRGSDGH